MNIVSSTLPKATFRPRSKGRVCCTLCGSIGKGGSWSRSHEKSCRIVQEEIKRRKGLQNNNTPFVPVKKPVTRFPVVTGSINHFGQHAFECPKCSANNHHLSNYSGISHCIICDAEFALQPPEEMTRTPSFQDLMLGNV